MRNSLKGLNRIQKKIFKNVYASGSVSLHMLYDLYLDFFTHDLYGDDYTHCDDSEELDSMLNAGMRYMNGCIGWMESKQLLSLSGSNVTLSKEFKLYKRECMLNQIVSLK